MKESWSETYPTVRNVFYLKFHRWVQSTFCSACLTIEKFPALEKNALISTVRYLRLFLKGWTINPVFIILKDEKLTHNR